MAAAKRAWLALSARQACVLATPAILVFGWLKWRIALRLSPQQAASRNAQQGDPWVAHMDRRLATARCASIRPWRRAAPPLSSTPR